MSGTSFDEDTFTIKLGEEEYETYIQAHSSHGPYLNKPMTYYPDLELICNNEMASGAYATALNSTSRSFARVLPAPGSPENQHTNSFNVIQEEVETEAEVQEMTSPDRANNSPFVGSKKRKKRDQEDDIIHVEVARMANALENISADKTVRYAKQLMEHLSPLQDEFSELVLWAIHQYFLENKNHGSAFIAYPHQMKINYVRHLMILHGFENSAGTGGANGGVTGGDGGGTGGGVFGDGAGDGGSGFSSFGGSFGSNI